MSSNPLSGTSLLAAMLARFGGAGVFTKTSQGFLSTLKNALGLGGGVAAGAALGGTVGTSVGTVATMPLHVANNIVSSGPYGWALVMGERYAYYDFENIRPRLEKGEKINDILQEYARPFMDALTKTAITSGKLMTEAIQSGQMDFTIGDNENLSTETPPSPPPDETLPPSGKTSAQIRAEEAALKAHIAKSAEEKTMKEFTTWLATFSSFNQQIAALNLQKSGKSGPALQDWVKQMNILTEAKSKALKQYQTWRKNNKRWLIEKGY